MAYTDTALKGLPNNKGFAPLYRLRWRFDFVNKKSKYGGWNSMSTQPVDMAAFVDKTGLLRASIETESISTYALKTMAEIDGHKYVSCSWKAAASSPSFLAGSFKTCGSVIGLTMYTEDLEVTVFVDGQIKVNKLKEHQKKIDVVEHKLGASK